MKIPTIKQMKRMSQKQIDKFVSEGLAEVCEDLANNLDEKMTPEMRRKFQKYTEAFRKLGKINNIEVNKPKKREVINMAKRLTDAENEGETKRILAKIRKFEKSHPQHLVERACYRYKVANLDRRKAEKEMKELEKRIANAKERLK